MKSTLIKKIISAGFFVVLAGSLNACGRAELPVYNYSMPQPTYTAFNNTAPEQKEQILVKFKKRISSVTSNEFNAKYGVKTAKVIPGIDVHVVESTEGSFVPAEQLVRHISADPLVKYAEVNGKVIVDPVMIKVNPIFSTLKVENYQKMIGKKIAVNGTYRSSRSGAVVQINDEVRLSIVDLDGTVVNSMPKLTEGAKITVYGLIKEVKGFNLTNNIGIMPVTLNTK